MIYILLIILALNYNIALKVVANILSGIILILVYCLYMLYVVCIALITIPNNTLLNIKRIYKYLFGGDKWK